MSLVTRCGCSLWYRSLALQRKRRGNHWRKAMTRCRLGFIAATAGALLFAGAPVARAHGPGFGGSSSGHASGTFQGPSTGNRQAFAPRSLHGPVNPVLGRPYTGAKPGYRQPLVWRATTRYSNTAKTNSTRWTSEATVLQQPPAAAPASMAMSSPGYALASYSASYCATSRGNCHLAEPQTIGDHCWCVGSAGQHVNGTVR